MSGVFTSTNQGDQLGLLTKVSTSKFPFDITLTYALVFGNDRALLRFIRYSKAKGSTGSRIEAELWKELFTMHCVF